MEPVAEADFRPFAFILMPFDASFNDIYKLGIKASAAENDIIAERVDEQKFSETILERIYRQIRTSDLIVADMTGQNPNVFYEVGYAHALGKQCILLTQDVKDIPFDLKHHRHIVYGASIETLKRSLSDEFSHWRTDILKRKSKTISISLKSAYGNLETNTQIHNAIVDIEIDIRNSSERKSPEIEAIYLLTGNGWEFSQDGLNCPNEDYTSEGATLRHFLKSPVPRLSPGAWGRLTISGQKTIASVYRGDELKDRYDINGWVKIVVVTSEGNIDQRIDLSVEVSELPF